MRIVETTVALFGRHPNACGRESLMKKIGRSGRFNQQDQDLLIRKRPPSATLTKKIARSLVWNSKRRSHIGIGTILCRTSLAAIIVSTLSSHRGIFSIQTTGSVIGDQ